MSGQVTVPAAGILFDNDGVIVSSIDSVTRCWRRWAARYGLPNADTVVVEHGTRAVEMMEKLNPGVDKVEGLRLIEDMELEDIGDLQVLPGVRNLLANLPPERWAIVSSGTHRLLVGRLRAAQLPVPERLISGEMVVHGKPDPEPYRRGAALLGFAPAECLVIEDAPPGVSSGVNAGCRVLGVLGTHSAEELLQAGVSWIVRTLEDVQVSVRPDGLAITMETI